MFYQSVQYKFLTGGTHHFIDIPTLIFKDKAYSSFSDSDFQNTVNVILHVRLTRALLRKLKHVYMNNTQIFKQIKIRDFCVVEVFMVADQEFSFRRDEIININLDEFGTCNQLIPGFILILEELKIWRAIITNT